MPFACQKVVSHHLLMNLPTHYPMAFSSKSSIALLEVSQKSPPTCLYRMYQLLSPTHSVNYSDHPFSTALHSQEAGNTLDDNTGDECGWFLPESAPSRRQLAGCTCPQSETCGGYPFMPSSGGPDTIKCDTGLVDDGNFEVICFYSNSTGEYEGGVVFSNCCPMDPLVCN